MHSLYKCRASTSPGTETPHPGDIEAFRTALLPLALILGAAACNGDDDTDDTDVGSDVDTDSDSDSGVDPTSITGIAASDDRFTILVEAATRVGLDIVLASPDIDYTIFAPTDDAFEALFEANNGVSSLDDLPDTSLRAILAYHGIPVEVMSDDIPARADSLADLTLFFNVGDTVMVNQATVIEADIDASNGVIHAIDSVLVPVNIAQAAALSGFTSLVGAVQASSSSTQGLIGNPDPTADPITVFAPTNEAFAEVNTSGFTAADFDAVLSYHVVDGAVLAADIPAAAPTLRQNDDGQDLSLVFGTDENGATVNDSSILITDIKATNGIIHVVDSVLMPGDVVDIAVWGGFDELVAAATAASVAGTLTTTDGLTVFAPTDAAFDELASVPTGAELASVLTYHVIVGETGLLSTDLMAGTETTLNGADVTIAVDGGVTVNGENVIVADIVGTNGVVHAIDGVLLPPTTR